MTSSRKKTLFCYGFLNLPVSFIGISLYLYIPALYHFHYGVSLYAVGSAFLIAKLASFALMPQLGIWLDRLNLNRIYRKKVIYLLLPLIALLFHFLIFPPLHGNAFYMICYLLTCIVYKAIIINYYAMGVEITADYRMQNYVSGIREFYGLMGGMMAAIFPMLLAGRLSMHQALDHAIFVLLALMLTAGILLHFIKAKPSFTFHPPLSLKTFFQVLTVGELGRFLPAIFICALASALPLATAPSFIKHIIGAPHLTGYFMLIFYFAAMASMLFWARYSAVNGKKNTLIVSLVLSVFFYLSAALLGKGDTFEFLAVIIAAGICTGAELMLIPSLFADNIKKREKAGIYFSGFLLIQKLPMSVGVLVAIYIMGAYGLEAGSIVPEESGAMGRQALWISFCIIPAALKLLAVFLVSGTRIDTRFSKSRDD